MNITNQKFDVVPMEENGERFGEIIKGLFASINRHKYPLILWVFFCVSASALYALSTPPTFSAVTTLLLEPRRQSTGALQDLSAAPILDVARAESEMQVIKSERLLAHVFNALDLSKSADFTSSETGPVMKLINTLFPSSRSDKKDSLTSPEVDAVAFAKFGDRVSVRRVGLSYVIEITYNSTRPELAQMVANSIGAAYLWQSINAKADSAKNGSEFIQSRVNSLSRQVSASSDAISTGSVISIPTPDADARIIGVALRPLRKSAPKTLLFVLLGLLLGTLSGCLTIAIFSISNKRIRSIRDLAKFSQLPCVAEVPKAYKQLSLFPVRNQVANLHALEKECAADRFLNEVVFSILTSAAVGIVPNKKSIGIVSWKPDVEKEAISIKIAKKISRTDANVIYIAADYDEANNPYGNSFDSNNILDLSEFINEETAVGYFHNSEQAGLKIVSTRSVSTTKLPDVQINLSKLKAKILLETSDSYVVLNIPPLENSIEARMMARTVDKVYLLVVGGKTEANEVLMAGQTLHDNHANLAGYIYVKE